MVTLEFFGACESVTGSKHLLTIGDHRILLDCGLFQGKRSESERRNRNFEFDPESVNAVIVSHAHIDHSGNLPNLVKKGFLGDIFLTYATAELLHPMLLDSAKIQEHDTAYLNKKLQGQAKLEPLYTQEDVYEVFRYFQPKKYHNWFDVAPGVQAKFLDAGHILGSALIVLEIKTDQRHIRIGYTGDLGRKFLPILRDPEQIFRVDYLICESTYGDRLHDPAAVAYQSLAEIVQKTVKRGGKIIIPSFAVSRAQELLYILHDLKDSGKIPHDLTVYLDSPLAIRISEVYAEFEQLYDEETQKLFLRKGDNPFSFTGLRFTESVEESKAILADPHPAIVIASSGMCEFGRIRHHLKNFISDPKNTIVFVGFQAKNTLGRKILRGDPTVNILDKKNIPVQAEVRVMNSLSAHADQNGLIEFIKKSNPKKAVFLVHGEEKSKIALTEKLQSLLDAEVIPPVCSKTYHL